MMMTNHAVSVCKINIPDNLHEKYTALSDISQK